MGLSLPVSEFPGFPPGRSASPSPTAELMRGAGTTPILAHHPDLGFGEMSDSIEEPSTTATGGGADFQAAWSTDKTGKAEYAGFDQAPWPEPTSAQSTTASIIPSASPTPEVDLFGLGGDFEDVNKNKPPRGVAAGNIAPPPSPFGCLDLSGVASNIAVQQQQSHPKTGVDDLNMAIQMVMQPTVGQQFNPAAPMASSIVPPSSSSSSLSRMDLPGSPALSGQSGFDNFGDLLQPQSATQGMVSAPGKTAPEGGAPKGSLIKGDLDSSLASLCQNLDINGPNQSLKKTSGHQWGSPKTSGRTGGQSWAPPAASQPPPTWTSTAQPAAAPFQQPNTPQWGAPPPSRPLMTQVPGAPMMGQAPFIGASGMRPPNMGMGQPPLGMGQPPAAFPTQQPPTTVNDPFGAL